MARKKTASPISPRKGIGQNPTGAAYPDTGMIIIDHTDTPRFLSPGVHGLLRKAEEETGSPAGFEDKFEDKESGMTLPFAVTQVAEMLRSMDTNAASGCPAVFEHSKPWGVFVYSAHWLDAWIFEPLEEPMADRASCHRYICIIIRYQMPRSLRIEKRLQALPLSSREREVCLLIAEGLSYKAIAVRLHIRPYTANTYVRRIFQKLNVRNRTELLEQLLAH